MKAVTWGGLALILALTETAAEQTAQVGQAAPDLTLSDSRGKVYELSSYRGQKKVVLEFFRSGSW